MEQLTKDGFERVMESLATFTYRPRPMIAVHPIEHPLWQALFGGTLPVTDFNSKRNELFRRFEAGELLEPLRAEAEKFAARYLPRDSQNREFCRRLEDEQLAASITNAALAAANRAMARAYPPASPRCGEI